MLSLDVAESEWFSVRRQIEEFVMKHHPFKLTENILPHPVSGTVDVQEMSVRE